MVDVHVYLFVRNCKCRLRANQLFSLLFNNTPMISLSYQSLGSIEILAIRSLVFTAYRLSIPFTMTLTVSNDHCLLRTYTIALFESVT